MSPSVDTSFKITVTIIILMCICVFVFSIVRSLYKVNTHIFQNNQVTKRTTPFLHPHQQHHRQTPQREHSSVSFPMFQDHGIRTITLAPSNQSNQTDASQSNVVSRCLPLAFLITCASVHVLVCTHGHLQPRPHAGKCGVNCWCVFVPMKRSRPTHVLDHCSF